MKKLILLITLCLVSCTAHIQPMVSPSEYLSNFDKIKGFVELYVTEEFRSFTVTKTDVSDLKRWELELGPAAVDAFRYELESKFEKVDVRLGKPSFPCQKEDLLMVVEPNFSKVGTHFPIIFKFETYRVAVIFQVKGYDKSGKLLMDKIIEGSGEKTGSIGFASAGHEANVVASKMAIKDAVSKTVSEVVDILSEEKIIPDTRPKKPKLEKIEESKVEEQRTVC